MKHDSRIVSLMVILVFALSLILASTASVFAVDPRKDGPTEISASGEGPVRNNQTSDSNTQNNGGGDASSVIGGLNNASTDVGVLAGPATAIIGLIKYIAIAVAFGMIIIIGIKWMTSGAGGKAAVKDTFLPYLIGAICVGAASAIAEFALGLGGK